MSYKILIASTDSLLSLTWHVFSSSRDSNDYKPVDELACTLISFERPTHWFPSNCDIEAIIRDFHLVVGLRQMLLLPEFLVE